MTRHLGWTAALSAALILTGCEAPPSSSPAPGGAPSSNNTPAPGGAKKDGEAKKGGGPAMAGGPNAPVGPPSSNYPGAENKGAAAPTPTSDAAAPAPIPTADAAAPAPAPAAGAAGALTPANTKIEFVGTKADGQHSGGFAKFAGSITPADGDFAASKISIEIETDSLTSDNPMLTNHLKAPDFFEVKKFPKASFVSKSIKAGGADGATHTITGDFTLHGVTKTIDIPAKVTTTDDALTLESKFQIDRTQYGMTYQPQRVNPIVTITVKADAKRK